MATLTIRNLDDALKQSLRVRAAHRNHSMEEEARQILGTVLRTQPDSELGLVERIRARFADLGDVDLQCAPREPVPPSSPLDEPSADERSLRSFRTAGARSRK